MAQGVTTPSFEDAPDFSVGAQYFLAAPMFAAVAGLLLAWLGGAVFASRYTPGILALTHLLTVGALAMAMAGCAALRAPQAEALMAQAPADLPAHTELAGTPFVPQEDQQCGPAALAEAMGAAGVAVPLETLSKEVFVPARGGSLQVEMLAAARRHGLVSTRLPPDLAELMREVVAGHPVVVLLNLGLSFAPMWHYAVVVGHDLAEHQILMRSGTTPLMPMDLRTFEHTWLRSGKWAFVALPPGDLPKTATEQDVGEALARFAKVLILNLEGSGWQSKAWRAGCNGECPGSLTEQVKTRAI